ncbi:hypothetical protein [Sulfobacillus thermosulfidooxidans]|uniref:arsenate reductase/protein-tyrosine-phosphatase family protein n=1 Tax=Sulfobacillus thermosulfidooxidans TaxID=28034 RepID=UPI0006B54E37|nr:hypothetical protein [Sulfobacillus thermosulfidooxidans]
MTEVPKILFVCTGNTCRSPMAEALWKSLCQDQCVVESAGLAAWPGQAAQEYAIEAVKPYGGNLQQHRSQDVRDVKGEFDWIFTMTGSQAEQLKHMRPEWEDKIFVLPQFLGEEEDIADPIGTNQVSYDSLAWRLYRLLSQLKTRLVDEDSSAKPENKEE